jgi:hypothetical protein
MEPKRRGRSRGRTAFTHAVTVVRTTDGSVSTGLTSAFIDGKPYLYAANFRRVKIISPVP